jgi:inhibitor of cysteine peptidase
VVLDSFGVHNFRVLRAGIVSHVPGFPAEKTGSMLFITRDFSRYSTTINNPASNLQTKKKYFQAGIMNHTACIISIGIVCLIAAGCAGCIGTGPGTPAGLPPSPTPSAPVVKAGNLVVTEEQNNATVTVHKGSTITVRLQENPTTGFTWNLSVSPGLLVVSDSYIPSDTTGKLIGSGGTHVWDISAQSAGAQTVTGVYMRPWEQATGNETAFLLNVVVV